jgi:hypothetical protein
VYPVCYKTKQDKTSYNMQCDAVVIKLLLIVGGVTFAQARCWGMVCLGE